MAEAHSVAVLGLRTTLRSVTGRERRARRRACASCSASSTTSAPRRSASALLGPEGATTVGAAAQWTFGFLANRCLTIAGGTSEIQRNVIGERLLGLPRDP